MTETAANLAFVFPGQGSQSVGMLAELATDHPEVRQVFDEASEGAGSDLWAVSQDGPEDALNRTEHTQPALLAAGMAVWRVWEKLGGARPARLAGHSLGEYTALVCAGALSLHDGAALVAERGRLMQAAVPAGVGAMAAVLGGDDAMVAAICEEVSGEEVVSPANFNSPGQVVIAGHAEAVERALARLAEEGVKKAVKLAMSVPSHCALMREAADSLAERMEKHRTGMRPRCPWCRTPMPPCPRTWRPCATRCAASCTCPCAGPSACRCWPPRASPRSANAVRARC